MRPTAARARAPAAHSRRARRPMAAWLVSCPGRGCNSEVIGHVLGESGVHAPIVRLSEYRNRVLATISRCTIGLQRRWPRRRVRVMPLQARAGALLRTSCLRRSPTAASASAGWVKLSFFFATAADRHSGCIIAAQSATGASTRYVRRASGPITDRSATARSRASRA